MAEVRGVSLVHLYEADSRADALDDPTWATCVAIAREIAVIFGALHPSIVVGDVSPNNVLVTRAGRVCLIDCDSMQYTDPTTRQDWPARMVTADYAPYSPGGQTRPLTADHDLFGLAILICELLMAGQHPYDGRPVGADRPEGRAGNIRLGANRLTRPASLGDRPGLIPATILPSGIRRLIMESFTAGTQASPGRPSALDWVRALDGLTNQITACGRSVYHRYPRYLGRCIWCDQVRAGIGDYFPPPTVSPPRQSTSESKRWVRKPPPPDYGHRPKPGTPPLPTWPDPRKIWKER
ncbi:hypothetical protein OHA70_29190 [Kribbella sp. NBC_00382]|uniref:hypothetical protein n=1 Tax=Kribbella sp. NBC_00382 TaxID=2975967 RepID=UPI002E1F036B